MRRNDAKQVSLQLTPAQWKALERYCSTANMDKAELIRACIVRAYPDFPTNIIQRGTYPRKQKTGA